MIYDNLIDMIGNTPILKLNSFKNITMGDVYIKLEKFNPGGSIKDRAALGMIEEAEKLGILKKGGAIVEPTSGNTGIGLAMLGRLKGYKVIIVMPDNMSLERRNLIKAYGAELVLTNGNEGMSGAIKKAKEIVDNNKGFYMPQQFSNQANAKIHYETTALEIIREIPKLDAFVASVGTAGTITGIAKRLKEFNNHIKVIAVEPKASPILSGGKVGKHGIQGIGANFIPSIYDERYIDEVITVSDDEAFEMARNIAQNEGVLLGISSGANIVASLKIAKKLGVGKTIVTISPDGGEKYLSTGIYD